MHLISFVSFKGGAGKTSALMGLTSCLANRGFKIGLLEADENFPLTAWRENALQADCWSDRIEIFPANDVKSLGAAYEQAEAEKFDFLLADTAGGGSDLNAMIVLNSALAIIPTQLTSMDVDELCSTYEYITQLQLEEKTDIPVIVLKQRVPANLSVQQKASNQLLDEHFVQFGTALRERDAFGSQKISGLLHGTRARLQSNPVKRLQAGHFEKAILEIEAVTDDILSTLNIQPIQEAG